MRLSFPIWMVVSTTLLIAGPAFAGQEQTTAERIETLSARIETLEDQFSERLSLKNWIENIDVNGLIEAEIGYRDFNPDAPVEADETTSDVTLSTVELGIDVTFNRFASGHLLFLWEEDETEPVNLDEGFITLHAGSRLPVYASMGKFYVPFGKYESHFISDPLTLELGETRESALMIGYTAGRMEIAAGAFNGDVDEGGRDDHVNGYFASADASFPDGCLLPGLALTAGASFISHMADSDLLTEDNDIDADGSPDGIEDAVPGISGYLSAGYRERLFFIAEYVGALDEFAPGEMALVGGRAPEAWNTELVYAITPRCGVGVKYEGTQDAGELLPEIRYGAIAFYQPVAGVYLGLEYLRETFANDDLATVVTAQLAYSF